tara:strand:+ start:24091 stop:24297 length:207 start_codon:yes stop_codon:yes gene_type:complete
MSQSTSQHLRSLYDEWFRKTLDINKNGVDADLLSSLLSTAFYHGKDVGSTETGEQWKERMGEPTGQKV